MNTVIEHAKLTDVNELLSLYLSVYGEDYPLDIGTKRSVMEEALNHPEENHWYVMRCTDSNQIIVSGIIQIERENLIGKLSGVAVHDEYRKHGLATGFIGHVVNEVLKEKKLVNSIYATARTISHSSQTMLMKNGFIPLGFFPNCRRIKTYETLALLAIFADGVLEKRKVPTVVPESVEPFYSLVEKEITGNDAHFDTAPCLIKRDHQFKDLTCKEGEFEFIFAKNFVEKRFDETFKEDRESVFYPFHRPNLLISNMEEGIEIFAAFSKKDHYCVIITANKSIISLGEKINKMLFAMKEIGIYYVETMVRSDRREPICFLTENNFLPSAVYPAMRFEEGVGQDYILLARTMVPLDFSELSIHKSFKPYLDQYAKQWIDMHLNILRVNS
ncbi:GNAT family N-acetyltransferase [Halobacteriovorax marinus]|nr:GNAT family N-acetyltransferase [Halobacteriovorax marinus]